MNTHNIDPADGLQANLDKILGVKPVSHMPAIVCAVIGIACVILYYVV